MFVPWQLLVGVCCGVPHPWGAWFLQNAMSTASP